MYICVEYTCMYNGIKYIHIYIHIFVSNGRVFLCVYVYTQHWFQYSLYVVLCYVSLIVYMYILYTYMSNHHTCPFNYRLYNQSYTNICISPMEWTRTTIALTKSQQNICINIETFFNHKEIVQRIYYTLYTLHTLRGHNGHVDRISVSGIFGERMHTYLSQTFCFSVCNIQPIKLCLMNYYENNFPIFLIKFKWKKKWKLTWIIILEMSLFHYN